MLKTCRIINLPKITDPRGDLTFVENQRHIPFEIRRVYYLYNVPAGADRGAHAHKELHQLIMAVSGSFDIVMDDGCERQRFRLDRPDRGLYIPPMMWREMENFSTGTVALVLASEPYTEDDYYRDYPTFLQATRSL